MKLEQMTKAQLIKEIKRLKRQISVDRKMGADSMRIANRYINMKERPQGNYEKWP